MSTLKSTLKDKLNLSETERLVPSQIAHDTKFNYTRRVTPKDGDELKTLSGSIGGESPVEDAVYPIIVRAISEEEGSLWRELHAQTDKFKDASDEDLLEATPPYVLVDGFGRMAAHIEAHGADEPIDARILDVDGIPEDQWKMLGQVLSGVLNSSARGMHYLDEADYYKSLLAAKLTQADIVKLTGRSKAYVSKTVKIAQFLSDKDRQKCINNGLSRDRAYELASNREQNRDDAGEARTSSGTQNGVQLSGNPLSAKERKFYSQGIDFCLETTEVSQAVKNKLIVAKVIIDFTNGAYENKPFLDVLVDEGIIPADSTAYDFENDTAAYLEQQRLDEKKARDEAKEAEKAAKQAQKDAEKAAKAAQKEAEKKAKAAQKEAEKAAKEAEKARTKAGAKAGAKKKAGAKPDKPAGAKPATKVAAKKGAAKKSGAKKTSKKAGAKKTSKKAGAKKTSKKAGAKKKSAAKKK